jgi:hypothetical protein
MESPRSSLLSTMVMTLPLVVVPAIALLRPPLPGSGTSTTALSAEEDDDFFSQLDVFEEAYTSAPQAAESEAESETAGDGGDVFDEWFEEDSSGSDAPAENSDSSLPPSSSPSDVDPFVSNGQTGAASGSALPQPNANTAGRNSLPPQTPQLGEQQWLERISRAGVQRTIWFSPGPQRFGFAAFVPGQNSSVTYRFEAVAGSRIDALQNVAQQLAQWQLKQQSRQAQPQ